MADFSFRAGEELTLWVRDRSNLSAFFATNILQKSLAQIGISCAFRGCGHLPPFFACLNKGDQPAPFQELSFRDTDSFQIGVTETGGVVFASQSKRGLTYAVWEFLEQLGWSWPTPSLERLPKSAAWSLTESCQDFHPTLTQRMIFLEEVQVTPEILIWFSKQRINTLFPSNPSRFSEPEIQFSDSCMARAQDLGMDFIIGGDWWEWIAGEEANQVEFPNSHSVAELASKALAFWEGMGDPSPRVSIWPTTAGDNLHLRVLEEMGKHNESLLFETHQCDEFPQSFLARTLFQLKTLPSKKSQSGRFYGEILESARAELDLQGGLYLSLSDFSDDGCLGNAVTPFLWPYVLEKVRQAGAAGLTGVALEFKALPLSRFLESAGFAVSSVARGMWQSRDPETSGVTQQALRDQFDTAGAVVGRLVEDFSGWVNQSNLKSFNGANFPIFPFQLAGDILSSEKVRDELDERISEIEESPPCEPCLELLRNLTTLVNLYDLEHTEDIHEATATAKTIWKKNEIDFWPEWLRTGSALVERLKPFL